MNNRSAYVLLNMVQGISSGKIRAVLQSGVEPAELFALPEQELRRLPGLTEKNVQHLREAEARYDYRTEIQRAERSGIRIVNLEDEEYPRLLRDIYDPPLCLYVRGDPAALRKSHAGIAMVGSRHVTAYGEKMAAFLAAAASSANWPVVSGLARGIDTAVHRAAVENYGTPIAVLGSGLFHVYPQENIPLARDICEKGGAVVSEFPLQTRPDRYNFPVRNRVISGMSRGTLVIEAGIQSGSLITARCAGEQNRTIFAVPGRADSPFSQGCHALLRDGAVLTETFQDVVDEFSLLPAVRLEPGPSAPPCRQPCGQEQTFRQEVVLPPQEYRIWEKVSQGEVQLDDLITSLDLPAAKVISTVLLLEMKRIVRQLPGKRIVADPDRKAVKSA